MKATGRITNPTVKIIRTNKSEGTAVEQKCIVAKVTFQGSEELLAFLFKHADAGLVIDLDVSQIDVALPSKPGKRKGSVRRGDGKQPELAAQ